MQQVRQLPREISALPEMFSFLESQFGRHEVGEGTAFSVNLAAEEIFTNLVRHNVARSDEISFEVDITDEEIHFRFIDRDVEPFDPASAPEVDVSRPAAEREPGGLGMHLVKSIVDRLHYEYDDGEMRVSVVKKRGAEVFEIRYDEQGSIQLTGRLDAAESPRARSFLDEVAGSSVVDFGELQYISSAGLGVLFAAQKRLMGSGAGLKLVNLNPHILEVFQIAGFDTIFEIE